MCNDPASDLPAELLILSKTEEQWTKATKARQDMEKRHAKALLDLERLDVNTPEHEQHVYGAIMRGEFVHEVLKIQSAWYLGDVAKQRGRVEGLRKLVGILSQEEAKAKRQLDTAHEALYNPNKPGQYKPHLLEALANKGTVCVGHIVTIHDNETGDEFDIEVTRDSEAPIVRAIVNRKVGDSIVLEVEGFRSAYSLIRLHAPVN